MLGEMKGKSPAILFYTSDFLTGTSFFNYEQLGRYIKLLCFQHQHGHLPENVFNDISNNDTAIQSKFKKDAEGFYYQDRLEKEIIKRDKYCESRVKNKEGKNQYTKTGHIKGHMTSHMENGNDNDNINDLSVDENRLLFNANFQKKLSLYVLNGIQDIERVMLSQEQKQQICGGVKIELNGDMYLEKLQRALNMTQDMTKANLNKFIKVIEADESYLDGLQEKKKHCMNWIKKNK